jgi:hypothetical protein
MANPFVQAVMKAFKGKLPKAHDRSAPASDGMAEKQAGKHTTGERAGSQDDAGKAAPKS